MADIRTLVLVDIENLMGGTDPSSPEIEHAVEIIGSLHSTNSLVVAAASHRIAARVAWRLPRVRWLWRSGPDGADRCLLEVIKHERVQERFEQVLLVSGDGIFAEPLAQLAAAGIRTTVMSRPESIAVRLRLASHTFIAIDLAGEVTHDAA